MNLIDTHCHLGDARLRRDVPQALARARQAGVRAVICAAANLRESEASLSLARDYEEVFCMAGVHPHDAKQAPEDYLQQIEQLTAAAENVAIGEIGLDYHYDLSPRSDQRRVFAEQLALAGRIDKPVVVHTREALDDTLAIVRASGADGRRIVFHSFTEGSESVRRVLDLGSAVSFSGIVTFKKMCELRQAARLVPDDRILIETDSPYLSPEPVRKMKTNEPANLTHVARRLGEVRGIPADALAELTTANAIRLFALDVS
ncbi:MAG: TatD family hydrolase [Phycisphaerae bacterium]|jgi:TatD DNase family protein|nr:TatD family hydrolase [Phycisphaerae bacterium]